MFSIAFDHMPISVPRAALDPRGRQLARIVEARNRLLVSRDLLYCSPEIRRIIEEDITVLISLACERR